jgi:hypothetical protein
MPLSNTSVLSCVELALYAILVPPALFIAYRHGRHGILGYFYLNISIAVRIAAAISQLVNNDNDNSNDPTATLSLTTAVLSSIGLSPLILAMSGILHELHHYLHQASAATNGKKNKSRWPLFLQVQIHTICTVGMVLLILGSIHLAEAKSASDANAAYKLRSAGAVLWFVTWLVLVQYIAWLYFRYRGIQDKTSRSTTALRNWTLVALLFGGAKVVYAAVYTLDHADAAINPITGSFAIKVVLVVGMQFGAALAMTVGGWMSLGIAREYQKQRPKAARRTDRVFRG